MKKGLAPLIDSSTKVLILGSLPSDVSIKQQEYYANRSNDFWKIIGSVIGEDLKNMKYEERLKRLLNHQIGLWDVYQQGERNGSMDKNISTRVLNDFSKLKESYPQLKLICFNGYGEAGGNEEYFINLGFKTKVLLSSSGANRRYHKKRLIEWNHVLNDTNTLSKL